MINIEVLDEKPLNSFWLSCSISFVVRFVFLSCFTSLSYWVLSIIVILSVWGELHGSLEGLKLKIREEKSEIQFDKP